MAAHAKLSPSSAYRWMGCPGSADLEAVFVEENNAYSDEGSAAHEIAEYCLSNGVAVSEFTELHNYNVFTDSFEKVREFIQEYVNYCNSQPGVKLFEQKVDYSDHVDGGFGTADCISYHEGTLWVTDLKYGLGVRVDAEWNPQGLCYALGAYSDFKHIFDIDMIKIAVCMPRRDHISEWSISVEDLIAWSETLSCAAKVALSEQPPFSPSVSRCQFCKARFDCRARALNALSVFVSGKSMNEDPRLLSASEIGSLYPHLKTLSAWCTDIKSRAYQLANTGTDIPGFKLVATKKNSAWIDADNAEKVVLQTINEEDAYTKKFLSPTQAKKLLPKGDTSFDHLIERPSGNPALVSVDDKRPALTIDPAEGFSAVDE